MRATGSVSRFLESFRPSTPSTIALAYAAAGFLWIAVSDPLAEQLTGPETAATLQTAKGIAFVAFSAGVIYLLLLRRRLIRSEDLDSLEQMKGAHTALTQSEARVRHLIDASLDAVITVAADDMILEWNAEAERLLGWTPAEAIGEKASDLLVPETQQSRYREELQRVAANGGKAGAKRFETAVRDRSDVEFPVEMTIAPVEWGDRVVVTLFVRDISALVRAAQEAQLIQAFVNAAPFAIVGIDENGVVLSWNPVAEEMYGWQAGEVRGGSASLLLPPRSDDLIPLLDRIRLAVQVDNEHAVHARRDGKLIAVVWTLAPLPAVGGLRRSALISADLSEREHLERRLSDAEYLASLGRLAGTVAHEFNNVLMGIQSFAEVIGRRPSVDEAVVRAAGQIRLGIQRGRHITEDILRFTRAAVAPALNAINLDAWLETIAEDLQELVAPGVTVRIECRAPGLHVIGDQGQLHQVVTNLAINAKDAMREGGEIRIITAPCPPLPGGQARDFSVEIAVSDSGHGMDDETAAHAFEPLFTTKKRGGTGLGLAVVQKIVRAHGGEIRFESQPGEGTTFHIQLPARYEEAPPDVPQAESRSFVARRILLIEDDVAIAVGLADVLRTYGMNVDVIHTGVAAVEAVRRFRPDVVVLDVGLPDRDGVEVFGDIAESYPALPVIFSTGHADQARIEGPLARGNVAFLRKPYPVESLLDQVEQLTMVRF